MSKRLKVGVGMSKTGGKFLRTILVLSLLLSNSHALIMCADNTKKVQSDKSILQKKRKKRNGRAARDFLDGVLQDVIDLHKKIFAWDSLKVATTVFPFYVGSRMIDERLQNCFYDKNYHKNIKTMPDWCHTTAKWSIAVPAVFFGIHAFLSKDEEMRQTSRMFLLGIPFVIWSKDLIKKLRFDANLRPWNEDFSCKKRSDGGFPSGHMAEATYTAVLFGFRFGPKFAVPLGALAVFVGTTFVTCNRHYLSQVAAGAGLGAIYALAASKVVDSKLSKDLELGLTTNQYGGPSLSLSYRF